MPRPKKLNRDPHTLQARISKAAYHALSAKAIELGYIYGETAALGEFFEAIANGDLALSKKKVDKPLDE